ncbi:MAG TPA: hypothetical protein VFX61_12075, partial [Micromonosporaceae bacterium]|nr:hypothetical protein [Micromonosporaceae bacterium]
MTATIERTIKNTTAPVVVNATMNGAGQPARETTRQKATRYVWATVRLALGWTFLWAFLDKTFGLGHTTEAKDAWINGGNPT